MPDYLNIAGRVRTTAADGMVAEAQEVKDLLKNKSQQELNNDFSTAIESILLLIPSAASSLNQLADKAFVNSSIATASATFRGTYNLVSDLNLTVSATHAQIGAALAGAVSEEDNNDYAFVQVPTSDATPTQIAKTERYKFNGTAWEYEYDLNNSGYTADQWAAINSGITAALVSKLSALPTNAELTTALGLLSDGIASINGKIPSEATTSNKLVDTAAMQSYVSQIINAIDATFNVGSADGHVAVQITQVNGVITNVAVTTIDIASAAALTLVTGRVTDAEANIVSLGGRMTTAEDDIDDLQQLYNNLQQSAPVVIEPTDTWPVAVADRSATVIYRVVDRVNTPPQYYSDYMFRASDLSGQPVLMAQYDNAIDPRPKKGSQNLVTSGGVFDNMGALDVSELNATENPHTLATYVDLSAALAAIPSDYQKGGMSVKFVLSSDNKYVQYLYHGKSITVDDFTNITNWEKTNLKEELEQLQLNVGLPLSIDVNSMEAKNYMLGEQNWYAYGKHCVIPVSAGDIYIISSPQTNYLAWLTSDYTQPSSASAVPYVSGTTRFNSRAVATKYIVPEGAAYLCFTKYENVDCLYDVQLYKKDSLSAEINSLKEVSSDFHTMVQGTIYAGEIEQSTNALSNEIYFKVEPGSTIAITRKENIEVRITEYNAAKVYNRQVGYSEMDSHIVGTDTEYVRISGRYVDQRQWAVKDFNDDFGIVATIPRYINELNNKVNDINLLSEQKLSAFYTFGEIIIDNVNQKFKCTANIATKVGGAEYIIPANTEVLYSTYGSALLNSIPCLILDMQNNTFKVVGWRESARERIILTIGNLSYDSTSGKITIHNIGFSSVPCTIINTPGPSPAYPYQYYGEKVNWDNNYYNRTLYKSFGLGWNQSCVCYNNYFLSFENANNTVRLYNLTDNSLLLTKGIPNGTYNMPHCNTACLGDTLYSENSIMPLVYVSQWTVGEERACFVYDVTLTNGVYDVTLVQVINLASISSNLIGVGACDFAVFQNKLYAISYKVNSSYFDDGANKTLINVFDLPSTADSEVVLTDNDVLLTKELPLIYMRQDLHVNGGNIYVAGGGDDNDEQRAERKITVINTQSLEITSVIPLSNFGGEPEGLTEHFGSLVITNTSGILYKIEFK